MVTVKIIDAPGIRMLSYYFYSKFKLAELVLSKKVNSYRKYFENAIMK